jgi:hypothetical protein
MSQYEIQTSKHGDEAKFGRAQPTPILKMSRGVWIRLGPSGVGVRSAMSECPQVGAHNRMTIRCVA